MEKYTLLALLSKLGCLDSSGFFNCCIICQYKDLNEFKNILEKDEIAFVGYIEGKREMTEKEVLLTEFFNDNFKMKSNSRRNTPNDYCHKNSIIGSGISAWMSRLFDSRERDITKKCGVYWYLEVV
ncbi:uncharacterized protein LOC132934426 [Metopolophium dirhodum]|uniref:uncharacterized protein LOC132934426 n=1 Tax=Metopolophium dirhodum TaxID=44670 RepID=UPI0029907136|nr:uncharacterized protein LOC132934426 [Metopolophium dirhodum]